MPNKNLINIIMTVKLYNLPQIVRVNSNPVTVTNTDSSQKRVRLYQGQDNVVNFSAFNSTNKMLAVSGTTLDRKSTRLNSSHTDISRMPSSA